MLVPFQQISDQAKIWIFQADKQLIHLDQIRHDLYTFLEEWTTHNQQLYSAGDIVFSRFVVIAVDENMQAVSGCSQDTLTHFILELGNKYQVNFLDRMQVAYLKTPNGEIETVHLNDLKSKIDSGDINTHTVVFNNLVKTKGEFIHLWQTPLKDSWHQKFI